jgi:hypothetical protein
MQVSQQTRELREQLDRVSRASEFSGASRSAPFQGANAGGDARATMWDGRPRPSDCRKRLGKFRSGRQPENRACIDHKSLLNSTQLHGYS